MTVNKETLIHGFSGFLSQGMRILVHSSLSSFGKVEGGALSVITALEEVITPEGLIMMPAFTYGRDVFEPLKSPSHTGLISEEFRRGEGVKRSMHPTHSVCAWGKRADDFLNGHQVEAPFSLGTPIHKLALENGFILLLGVGQEANSLMHVAQELAGVPYLDRSKLVKATVNARELEVKARRAGCSLGFGKAEAMLERENLVHYYKIGDSVIRFMLAKPVLESLAAVFKKDPLIFICDNANCFACNEAKELTKAVKNG